MKPVVLYSKPGCSLCEKARAALDRAEVAFTETDISGDPFLQAEFGMLVPVVEVGGDPVFYAGMDPEDLADFIQEAQRPEEL